MNHQKTIDLHGFNESQALTKIIMALYEFDNSENFETLKIIVGKGEVLTYVVIDQLDQNNYEWVYDGNNSGAIIVFKKQNFFSF